MSTQVEVVSKNVAEIEALLFNAIKAYHVADLMNALLEFEDENEKAIRLAQEAKKRGGF